MTVVRAQCSFLFDTAFPRDRLMINPCFEMTGAIQDADSLAENIADALQTWRGAQGELVVKTYDVEGTPPVFPNGVATRAAGIVGASGSNRETALCLSFYSGTNQPRNRGRLFIPLCLMTTGGSVPREPSAANISYAMSLGPVLAGIGGADVDWVVWSKADQAAKKVSNYWVDNEWDVQRSRGLRATTRSVASTSG